MRAIEGKLDTADSQPIKKGFHRGEDKHKAQTLCRASAKSAGGLRAFKGSSSSNLGLVSLNKTERPTGTQP